MELKQKRKEKPVRVESIRSKFPMINKRIDRKPFIYFDNAATGQKPKSVLQKLQDFYTGAYAKPKEDHKLGRHSSELVEEARKKIAKFIGASSEKTIVFTRGCTESINLVAQGFAKSILKKNDEVIITALEHHANIVPWQMACAESGAILKVVPLIPSGEIDLHAYGQLLTDRVKVVAVSHSSHVLGTILPVKEMIRMAHRKGIPVMLDGAQTIPHMPVNVQELDCEFYTFSAHKMGGPAGVGILYGKKKWLEQIPPALGGADMAKKVSFEKSEYADVPTKFEAGTMPFEEIIAFGELTDFLTELNMQRLFEYEQELLHYATAQLVKIEEIRMVGTAPEKEAVISFHLGPKKDVKEVEKHLSKEHNIFVRSGDLSAQPLIKLLGVKGLVRISFSFYNTKKEIDRFVAAMNAYLKRN
jgi:cysteine desulfurase/selenocysteine lyase